MLLNFYNNFLGESPKWYKNLIILFLVSNPLIYIFLINIGSEAGFIMGWIILAQFILTLAMALNCYPLQPGGLIAIQSVLMGLTNTKNIYHEVELNLKVILLLVFMVAGIYFMKDFLLYIFTKLLVNVRNKRTLSVLFVISAAVLSAFLDALTVTAVLIAVAVGFYYVFPISLPVFIFGLLTCYFIEKFKLFGYGAELSDELRLVIENFGHEEDKKRTSNDKAKLFVQLAVVIILILSLAFNLAAVGLIGLMVIVLLTAFNGIIKEHDLGKAFEEALPFTALLVVFFVIVAVIHDQHLFSPVIGYVLTLNFDLQVPMFFLANGVLSMISDNVFVATIYISEVKEALDTGLINREQFDLLAIAINTGTNLPSVATPNGQAAFLFLLTSSIAPLIGLSYFRMVLLALPYTIVLTVIGLFSVIYFL